MGSPPGEPGRFGNETQHRVVLTEGFWMAKYEVTQKQWESVMGTTVREQRDKSDASMSLRGEGDDYPMYFVSWDEAQEFCRKAGHGLQLPTEAQWEYACRAGTEAALGSGMNLTNASVDDAAGEVAWYAGNAEGTQAVGQKPGNGWGLYDMHGNVAEWCADGPWEYPAGGTSTDPAGFWPIC